METAHWLEWEDVLRGNLPEGRVYLGAETCAKRLPGDRVILRCLEILRDRGRAATLVTPYVAEQGLERLAALFAKLAQAALDCEVVCSDWGVFERLGETPGLAPVIGRLLARQCADPRLATLTDAGYQAAFEKEVTHLDGTVARLRYRPPTEALLRHLRSPAIVHPDLLAVLAGLGAARFEASNLLQGLTLDVPAGWRVSLHAPEAIISVRRCLGEAGSCGSRCSRQVRRLDHPAFPVPLWISACEVFYCNEALPDLAELPAIDRLVVRGRPD